MEQDPAYQGDNLEQPKETEPKPERRKAGRPKSLLHGTRRLKHNHYEIVNLKPIHYRAIELIRKGDMIHTAIAAELGVSYKTFWVWKSSHAFREELLRQQEEALTRLYDREVDYAKDAIQVLHLIAMEPKARRETRINAAKAILSRLPPTQTSSAQITVTPASKVTDMSSTPDDRLTELYQDTDTEAEDLNETPL